MRQGEIAPKSAWVGNPQGGVAAPTPILPPDPARLFARRAERFNKLAVGHPMQAWLNFMGSLAWAQDAALAVFSALRADHAEDVRRAVEAGLPPLAAAGHRRDPLWRDGLQSLLASLDHAHSPPEARQIAKRLRESSTREIEAMADEAVHGGGAGGEAGACVYVVAALQVYFAARASRLPADALRLLPERGLCPCCGSTPVAGIITAAGATPGLRYLHCSLCATTWNHTRAICITCGESRSLSLEGVEGDAGVAKAEVCGECRTYAKMLYAAKDPEVDPVADDFATLGLDLMVAEAGWSRHARNPLLPG